jgi:hypothetical protein
MPRLDAVPRSSAFVPDDSRAAPGVRAAVDPLRLRARRPTDSPFANAPPCSAPADASTHDADPLRAWGSRRSRVSAWVAVPLADGHVVVPPGRPGSTAPLTSTAKSLSRPTISHHRGPPAARAARLFGEMQRRGALCVSLVIVAACGGDRPPPMTELPPPVATAPSPPPQVPSSPDSIPVAAAPSASANALSTSSTKVDAKHGWSACHDASKRGGPPEASVDALANGCAKATGLKRLGETIVAERATSGGAPASYPLPAKAGHCYRAFGQGDQGVRDLDLALIDSTGVIAAEDETESPTAVLLVDGALCFKIDDAATIAVRVESGKGKYAIQLWGDE